jgi:hypothetical protein
MHRSAFTSGPTCSAKAGMTLAQNEGGYRAGSIEFLPSLNEFFHELFGVYLGLALCRKAEH